MNKDEKLVEKEVGVAKSARENRMEDIPINKVLIAHAGDGNFHTSVCFDPPEEGKCKEAERLKNFMVNAASEMEGTCTGEHGVGTAILKFRDWTKHGPKRATKMTTQVDLLSEGEQ